MTPAANPDRGHTAGSESTLASREAHGEQAGGGGHNQGGEHRVELGIVGFGGQHGGRGSASPGGGVADVIMPTRSARPLVRGIGVAS